MSKNKYIFLDRKETMREKIDRLKNNAEYKKQVGLTRKKLHKLSKEYNSWDFEYMLKFIDAIVKDWLKYYEDRYKFTTEIKDDHRIEIVKNMNDYLSEYFEDYTEGCAPKDVVLKNLLVYMSEYLFEIWD